MSNTTSINMVIGHPLTHSQSPLLHQELYRMFKINAVMVAESNPSIKVLIERIKTLGVKLTAVTMPFKTAVIDYLDELSPEVLELRAANTIIQKDNKLFGYNTDVAGVAFALRNINIGNKTVLVIGAGGTAKAVGYFLAKNNAKIFWHNRTQAKAAALAQQFGGNIYKNNKDIFDIIINTTPIGLYPNIEESPLEDYKFHAKQIVFDVIYNPVQTKFLQSAAAVNATTISGLDMFIGQGLKQVELLMDKYKEHELYTH